MKNQKIPVALLSLCLVANAHFAQDDQGKKEQEKSGVASSKSLTTSDPSEDEISLVIKGKIIAVTDKEIIYKETGSNTEGRAPIHNLHFLRRANGEYRFFTPAKTELVNPTKIATEEVKPKEKPEVAKVSKMEFYLLAGGITHFAKNSDSTDYISGLSAYIARVANQTLNPKGFSSRVDTSAAGMQFQGFAEPRLAYGNFMLGLSAGYAIFPKVVGIVSSPNYSNPLKLTLEGYFIPAFAIVYYRFNLSERWSLNLGLGAGVMHTSIKYTEDDAFTVSSQRFTAWSMAAVAKPEIMYKLGRLVFSLSAPFYFAESRKVESGSTALMNGDTGKVISPNLTGISVSLAIGYQLR